MNSLKDCWHRIAGSRWLDAVLALLLVALTYPAFEPDYGVGLDSSYVWGLNWLFDHDYHTLTHLIYPYGPLALLRLPVIGWHFTAFLLFFSVCKTGFVMLALAEARRGGLTVWIAILAIVPACIYGNIDTYLVLDVALLVHMYVERRNVWAFAIATVLSVLALTIKSSFGVQSLGVLFVGWIIAIVRHRDVKATLLTASMVPVALLAVGLAVYHSFGTMLNAYVGVLMLTDGYAASMVLMVEHRLWTLSVFWVAIVALLPLSRDGAAKRMWLVLALPLFANWKYGILREDFWHFRQLFCFAAGFAAAVLVSQKRFRLSAWLCSAVAMGMLVVNLSTLEQYEQLPLTTAAPANVVDMTVGYSTLKAHSEEHIDNAMSLRKLPDSTLAVIADGSVDCYPWEHVFIAANGLRWQPRVTVEADFSPRLSYFAAENYQGNGAVDFILMHRTDFNADNGLRTVDGRYMLNDEPAVMSAIMAGYDVADSGWYGLLLQRRQQPMETSIQVIDTVMARYGEWIDVPQEGAVRARISAKRNILGVIAEWIYKPDIHTMDYLMPDGSIRTYRYSPVMVQEGLWAGPLATNHGELARLIQGLDVVPQPKAIRLNAIHPNRHKSELSVVWAKNLTK